MNHKYFIDPGSPQDVGSELVELVTEDGDTLGVISRAEAHTDPSYLHRVVHVLVFNERGDMLVQKRSMNKDVAPGLWDVSVGGHVIPGETPLQAATRELREELGIVWVELRFLYDHVFLGSRESEFVSTYECIYSGRIFPAADEIDEVRFRNIEQIGNEVGQGIYTEHFEQEILLYRELYG